MTLKYVFWVLSLNIQFYEIIIIEVHYFFWLQPSFGICFDVDGVIAHGTHAIPAAASAFKRLVDDKGQFKVPVAFVTNSLNRRSDRAKQLTRMIGVTVCPVY